MPDEIFDFLDFLFGLLQPRASRCFEIDDKLAGIGARKVGDPNHRHQTEAHKKKAGNAQDSRERATQRHRLHGVEATQKRAKTMVKHGAKALHE